MAFLDYEVLRLIWWVLLGVLLTIAAGPATTVPAILGAVIGILARMAVERHLPVLTGGQEA